VAKSIFIVTLPIRNGLVYRNSDYERLNGINLSAWCTIFDEIPPVTPKVYADKKDNLPRYGKNRHITPK